ncbi:Ig-like domain-containing protein, partial [Neptuniibacter sp.]|uniref:Ig-like domain-containing protein n=1 Tax=Neptuniibacter sp. TaxID=1962643 RepID=UPI00261A1C18
MDSNLVITFAEDVDAETGNIYLKKSSDGSTIQTFDVTSDISGSGSDTITINPSSDLASETGYYVQIDTTAFDDSSSNSYAGISATTTWNFTSADVISPTVTFDPLDSATAVAVDSNVTITFNEAVRKTDNSALSDSNIDALIILKETNASGSDISFDATINAGKTVVTINPTSNLSSEQVVYVAIGTTVEDDSDNAITAANATFTAADVIAPTVTFSPLDSATAVAVYSNVTITFNEAVRNTDDSALTDSNIDALITLKETNASGSDIAFDATINAGKTIITINPTSRFSREQVVYVAIGATVEDDEDNAITAANATFTAEDIGTPIHKASITGAGSPNYLGNAMAVCISGNYAYVASKADDALSVFDISDAANGNLTLKAAITGSGSPNYLNGSRSVYVSDDYAYVASVDDDALSVFDISDAANGNITHKAVISGSGSPNYLNGANSVYVSGNYAYVASDADDALTVFDISDIANGNITHKAAISGSGSPNYLDGSRSVCVSGNYAYVSSALDDALSVFDISDVANGNLTLKTVITGEGSPNYLNYSSYIDVSGNYAYVSSALDNALSVFDISDVANGNITHKAVISGSGSPNYLANARGVNVSGNYAYVASNVDDALSVFDISDIANGNISLDGAITGAGSPNYLNYNYDVTYSDGYVYTAAYLDSSLSVFQYGPPAVTFSPLDSATAVAVDSNITITFNEAVRNTDDSALTDSNIDALITLKETNASGSNIAFDATINAGKTVVTINPTSNLSSEQVVYVAIGTTVEDDADNAITASNASFTAADIIDPTVSTLSPADGATAVAVDSNLVITFAEDVDAETGNIYIKKSSDNSTIQTFDVTSDISGSGSDTITINPSSDLASETGYYVQIDTTAFDDPAGNSYTGISATTTWNFTSADVIAPTVTFDPLDSATGVLVDSNVTITFNEAVRNTNDTALTDSNIDALLTLKETNASGSDIAFDATINAGKTVVTINPTSNLSSEQVVYVAIGTTVEDDSDNAITAANATFTAADIVAPTVTFSPLDSATSVAVDSNVTITFNEAMRN